MAKKVPKNAVLIPDTAERVFKGVVYDVFQWQQRRFDGSFATFEMLRRPDTVQTIAIVDGKIVVLADEQPHRGLKMSLPGGRVDPGEDTLIAAQRELSEEAGLELSDWRLVSVTQPVLKIEWFVYTYLAFGQSKKNAAHPDAGEKITIHMDDFKKLKQRCMDREGFMGDLQPILKNIDSAEQLLELPEFDANI